MTLKTKSIIISLLLLIIIAFSLTMFADYNALNNSIIRSMLVTENILYSEDMIYKSLTGREPDTETAKRTIEKIPEITAPVNVKELAYDELHHFVTVKMSFMRIGRLLKMSSGSKTISEPELRQIQNELLKIEDSITQFRESFGKRIEREKTFKKNAVTIIYASGILGIIFVLISFYRYFIGPILDMSTQIKAVRDGKIENISIYKARDEIGRLSDFTYQTLNELYKSSEALSQRLEMQYAISEILKAFQESEDIDVFLKKVLETILSLKWLSIMLKGGIFLVDEADPNLLVLRAEKNFMESQKKICGELPLGKCICGRSAESGEIVYEPSHDVGQEYTYEGMTRHGHYCVPIKYEQKVLGVISLYLEEGHILNKTQIEFIETIAIIVTESLIMKRHAEREHLITRAVEESGEGVAIANRKGVIEYINPALERITGYSRDEIIGSSLTAHIRSGALTEAVMKEIMDGNLRTGAGKNKRKDGAEYQEYMTVIPVRDESGELIKFVSIRRDITKETRLEEQLAQIQKMELVGRLAGGIAHDFNNYLTAILGHGGIAIKKMKEEDPARKGVETMMSAAQMAANLTKQLLAFSRKQILQPEVIQLNSVVENTGKMLRRIIGENVEFEIVPALTLWNVKVDAGQIEQAIMNLVVNARDAMPEGGKLTIETANVVLDESYVEGHIDVVPGEYVMVSVSDTGHGMTDEVKSHIFEPFFTTKERGRGTGLGLAMVHGIVKQNNGHIYVYSEIGRGTTFKMYLPRVKEQMEVKKKEVVSADMARGSETVLVVEDQDMVRRLASDILSGLGYTVIEAKDGFDALELCGRYHGKIHLLLTDVIMPKMGGNELSEKIKERQPGIKVLYMSGYTDNTIAHHGILDKGIHLIHKPFTESGLAEEVRRVLDS